MNQKNAQIDPITLEIIQSSLTSIADEMFVSMALASMSSVIYEVLDFGVAITDAKGELASAGAGIPSFVGMLDPAVKAIRKKFEGHEYQQGDIFISNDPFTGGVSHANDVVLAMPVFYDGEVIAWTANKGHWVDIGGMVPGSLSPDATELFQEGLILPNVHLFKAGEAIESVFDIIRGNSRLPDQAIGDLWAGIAALRVGDQRLQELCVKYGIDTYKEAVKQYFEYGEAVAQAGLSKLPNGTCSAEDTMDDGRTIRVAVTITDDEFLVDLRNNPIQDDGPINGTYHSTLVCAQVVFKSITVPDPWANAGSFRPVKLVTDPGSIFHAIRPAAVGLYYENKIRVSDLICKALASHMLNIVPAGHFSSICATLIRNQDASGQEKTFIEPEVGGWGASATMDGDNAQFSASHGNTYNCPIEVNEARNGIEVEHLALNDEPAGPGQYRGGKGIDLRYRILGEKGWVTAKYTRSITPPWGINGGGQGSLNRLSIIHVDGSEEVVSSACNLPLVKGEIVHITTANGGGYGDPINRATDAVLDDVKNGYVSPHEAQNIYGIEIH